MSEMNHHLLEDGLVSVAEACKMLSLSKTFVYSLMQNGELPFARIGTARRIPKRALFDLIEKSLSVGCRDHQQSQNNNAVQEA